MKKTAKVLLFPWRSSCSGLGFTHTKTGKLTRYDKISPADLGQLLEQLAWRTAQGPLCPFATVWRSVPYPGCCACPSPLEILPQNQVDENHWTEVSTSCIYCKDWETHTIRRSFTCQFHPELMADIRDIGKREGPRYGELKDNDGVRLLVRLLYHGMQE